jgi:hypothetical protein
VYVDVDQTRRNDQAMRVNDLAAISGWFDGDATVYDIQIGPLIPITRWINDSAVLDDQIPHRAFRDALLQR